MSGNEAGQAWPDRPHLTNSRPLIWTRVAADHAATDAIGHLLGLLEQGEERGKARRPDDRERLRATMEAMVLDLYASAKTDPERFLTYSRRKADYGEGGEQAAASLTSVTTVADFLARAGFAVDIRGSFARKANPFGGADVGSGYRSRIRAAPLMVALLESVLEVGRNSVGAATAITGNPIRVTLTAARGTSKPRVKVKLVGKAAAMAERIVAGNRLRAMSSFSFDGPAPPEATA